ncbi:MAG: transposase [Clostridia bacterium]
MDGLNGLRKVISAVYPKSQMQRCIVHQIRFSTRYVSCKDINALMANLKPVYQAINEEEGMATLLRFAGRWNKQYLACMKSWLGNL